MEVITFESEAYKALVGKIEKIARYVAEAQLPSEEKKEAWLDSNQLAEALGISTRTLQRLRDENLISYSMLRGRCMYKLSEVERCLEERTIRCKPQTLEDFRNNYLTRTCNDKKGLYTENDGKGHFRIPLLPAGGLQGGKELPEPFL